jgi:hypothetical protein
MPVTGFSDGSQAGEEVPYQELPGQSYNYVPMPDQPGPSYQHHPADTMGGGERFSDGNQAHGAPCCGDNGGGMGGSFLDLLNAGESFASDFDDGFYFTSGGDIEFSSHGGATQDTHPPNDQT